MPSLEILHNDFPVPGSQTHPTTRIRTAAKAFFVVGVLSLLPGFAAMMSPSPDGIARAIGIFVESALFVACGAFTWRLARWALFTGVALYTIESVFGLVEIVSAVPSSATFLGRLMGFVLWRTIFYIIFWRAIRASGNAVRRDPNAVAAEFR